VMARTSCAEFDDGKAFPPMSPPGVVELTDDQVDKQNALKQAAVELLEDGKHEEALAKFSEAIVVGCASALMYSRRAGILMQLGRPNAVINDCTAALEVNPDSAKAFKMRGRAKAKLELWEEANLDFQTGLKIDHDDDTEEEAKIAAEKAKTLRDATVKERVQKEKVEFDAKLIADKAAYTAAMKAREEIWTDAKEAKYQETCKKAEEEKKRKESKASAAKETDESRAAAQEAAEKQAAADKAAAEKRLGKDNEGGASSADAPAPNAPVAAAEPESNATAAEEPETN